jgi:hypothetical protein
LGSIGDSGAYSGYHVEYGFSLRHGMQQKAHNMALVIPWDRAITWAEGKPERVGKSIAAQARLSQAT